MDSAIFFVLLILMGAIVYMNKETIMEAMRSEDSPKAPGSDTEMGVANSGMSPD